jgi:Icc-related predicted phosphoesterase
VRGGSDVPRVAVRCVLLSDTHEVEGLVRVPDGDVLIHTGDLTYRGDDEAVFHFVDWFRAFPHPHKVFIAGNHDRYFERETVKLQGFPGILYLQDDAVTLDGVKFYGTPWQPKFCSWAFNVSSEDDLRQHYAKIPEDTEVLLTHCPPHRIFDAKYDGERQGSTALRERVLKGLPHLRLHAFGHVHDAYGQREWTRPRDGRKTMFANAAICNRLFLPLNKPIVVDL